MAVHRYVISDEFSNFQVARMIYRIPQTVNENINQKYIYEHYFNHLNLLLLLSHENDIKTYSKDIKTDENRLINTLKWFNQNIRMYVKH